MTCDKMVTVKEAAIPGYTFPLTVEWVTYWEYELVEVPVDAQTAEEELAAAWENNLQGKMVAGEIVSTQRSFLRSGELYVFYGESTCKEMIAKWMPFQQIYEGE